MSPSRQIHLVIGHSDRSTCVALRRIIAGHPSLIVDAEASEGPASLAMIQEFSPAIALLEDALAGKGAGAIAKAVRRSNLPVGIVIFARDKDEEQFNTRLNAGIRGYIFSETASSDLLSAIREVAAGRIFVSSPYAEFLARRERLLSSLRQFRPSIGQLTATERKVLLLIAECRTTREIAGKLDLSEKTVENHRTNIAQKLGLQGARSVLKFASEYRSIL